MYRFEGTAFAAASLWTYTTECHCGVGASLQLEFLRDPLQKQFHFDTNIGRASSIDYPNRFSGF
jgi:hypothetical protein